MGRRGVHVWDWVTALLGVLLFLSLFLTWYSANKNTQTPTGWQALALVDKIVLVAALLAIALPFVARVRQTPADAQRYVIAVAAWGLFTAIVLAIRIADAPTLQTAMFKTHVKAGPWVALGLSILVIVSALLAGRSRVASRAANVS